MKTEAHDVGVLQRGKADHSLCCQVVRGRVQLGIDDVTGDDRRWWIGLLREEWSCRKQAQREKVQCASGLEFLGPRILLLHTHIFRFASILCCVPGKRCETLPG